MHARTWSARIDPDRRREYMDFAYGRSLPMFAAHEGFQGCAFLGDGMEQTVVTLWRSAADIDALERSRLYRETVEAILSTGFIVHANPTYVGPIQGRWPTGPRRRPPRQVAGPEQFALAKRSVAPGLARGPARDRTAYRRAASVAAWSSALRRYLC